MDLRVSYKTKKLDSLWLVLTYRCQFNCDWCYTRNGSVQQDMDLYDALNTCKMFANLGGKYIILIGGEPLLYDNLSNIVKKCTNHKLDTILITNGLLLESEECVVNLKNSGLTRVIVSLHPCKIDFSNGIIDQKLVFSKIQQSVKNICKMKINYEISCVIDFKIPDYFLSIFSWARENQTKSILFQTYVPPVGTTQYPKYLPLPKESARLVGLLYKESTKFPDIKCQFVFQYPFCLFEKRILSSMLKDEVLFGSHEVLYMGRGVALDPLGNFLPSSHWVGFPLFHLDHIRENGNISHTKFLKKWNSKKVINFRKKLWENLSIASEKCNNCELWPSRCVGGNPLIWQIWNETELLP